MDSINNRCPNCMKNIQPGTQVCPVCKFNLGKYQVNPNCQKPFTVLEKKYMLGRVLGVGGFGITYIGWDLNLQTYIAIKEYYPDSMAKRDITLEDGTTTVISKPGMEESYNKGLNRYVEEARNISRFYKLEGIVSVKDFFYANGTGYIVMEYINGIDLKKYLKNRGGRLDEKTALALMKPVFESMNEIHKTGLIHRDISPDNIMVDKDGKIKLIDFGSARGQSTQESDKTYTVILKHGYAPAEQYYSKGKQGPWTDIYSLCATLYKILTGVVPPNSVERMENDEYVSPSAYGVMVSPRTEVVLRKGLAVKASDRYQNIGELLNDLYGNGPIGYSQAVPNSMAYPNSVQPSYPLQSSQSLQPNQSLQSSQSVRSYNVQQSQQLQQPSSYANKGKNKGLIIGVVSACLVFVLVISLALGAKKDNKSKTTETSETSTRATSEDYSGNDGNTTQTYADNADYESWRDAYITFLDNWEYNVQSSMNEGVKIGNYDDTSLVDYNDYVPDSVYLYDFDVDGTPELLLRSIDYRYYVYAYSNSEVVFTGMVILCSLLDTPQIIAEPMTMPEGYAGYELLNFEGDRWSVEEYYIGNGVHYEVNGQAATVDEANEIHSRFESMQQDTSLNYVELDGDYSSFINEY